MSSSVYSKGPTVLQSFWKYNARQFTYVGIPWGSDICIFLPTVTAQNWIAQRGVAKATGVNNPLYNPKTPCKGKANITATQLTKWPPFSTPGGKSHIKRTGCSRYLFWRVTRQSLSQDPGNEVVKKSGTNHRVFNLKESTEGALAVPFRVSNAHKTGTWSLLAVLFKLFRWARYPRCL